MQNLCILSGGAAFGLVNHVQSVFSKLHGLEISGTYSAVGQMRDQLLGGAACDVVILTKAMIAALEESGHAVKGSARDLGKVRTGIAMKSSESAPQVQTASDLKAAMLGASGIYFPDPIKATAGIHFMNVLKQLGIAEQLSAQLRPYANGATAMRAMAECDERGLIGCTQITEIRYTKGVQLVAPLPNEFELATVYTAAVCTNAAHPNAAHALIEMMVSHEVAAARLAGGFE